MPGPSRNARAPWGSLSRQQVIDAASRAVRSDGFEKMTIRSLAADLHVSPMSLYRHVRDKDDLLVEVVDRLLARRWKPRVDRGDWSAWMTEAVERFRDFLVHEPAALYIYLRQPVVSPTAIERMQAMLDVLGSTGLDRTGARQVYATLHTYTIGFAALEASRARSAKSGEPTDEVTRLLATFTTSRQFSDGLAYLLEGVEHRLVRQAPAP